MSYDATGRLSYAYVPRDLLPNSLIILPLILEERWTQQPSYNHYSAALAMLEEAVKKCPLSIWDDAQAINRFWRVAFHTLFYTHLYLQSTEEAYTPWEKHRGEAEHLGTIFWEGNRQPVLAEPYTPTEILEYVDFCRIEVAEKVPPLDFAAPSGFDWLPFNKLELQLYNIRHIQHHTGELYERLGARAGADLPWIGQVTAARSLK